MNEKISRQLREAAEAHEPNRARILARVERGVADPTVRRRTPSIARSGPRAAIVAVIAAATLATGGLAVAAIGGVPSLPAAAPTPTVPPPAVTSTPTPSARSTSTTTRPAPATTSATPPASSRPTPPAASRVQDGPLWSQGSIDADSNIYWAQNNLTLKTSQPLTSLTVELRIAQTGGVQKTGNWQTLPNEDFTVTVQESDGALLYRWVLNPGRTVPVGQHVFSAQYNHATGNRKAKRDTYDVHTHGQSGSNAVWGDFTSPR